MPRGCPGAAGHRCNWLMHKSSSSLVLHKACSIKLYSSAVFLIFKTTRSTDPLWKVFVSRQWEHNRAATIRSAKISPTHSSLPDGENFSNDALLSRSSKLYSPKLCSCCFLELVYLWFSWLLLTLHRLKIFSQNARCYEYFFTPSRLKSVMQNSARLILVGHWTHCFFFGCVFFFLALSMYP